MPIGKITQKNTKRYELNRDTNFYVNCHDGDDSKGGLTPDSAVKTIEGLLTTVIGQYNFTNGARPYAVLTPGRYEIPAFDFPIIIANPVQTTDGYLFVDHEVVYNLNQFKVKYEELLSNDQEQKKQLSIQRSKIEAVEKEIETLRAETRNIDKLITREYLDSAVEKVKYKYDEELSVLKQGLKEKDEQLTALIQAVTYAQDDISKLKALLKTQNDHVNESINSAKELYVTVEDFDNKVAEMKETDDTLYDEIVSNKEELTVISDNIVSVEDDISRIQDTLNDQIKVVENYYQRNIGRVDAVKDELQTKINKHFENKHNPHEVVAEQVIFNNEMSVETAIRTVDNKFVMRDHTTVATVHALGKTTIKEALMTLTKTHDVGPKGAIIYLEEDLYTVEQEDFLPLGYLVQIIARKPNTKIIPAVNGELINLQGSNCHYAFHDITFDHPKIDRALSVKNGALCIIDNCTFGETLNYHMYVETNGIIKVLNGYKILTNSQNSILGHACAVSGGSIDLKNSTITISGELKCNYFAIATSQASQDWSGVEIEGKIKANEAPVLERGGTVIGKQNIEEV